MAAIEAVGTDIAVGPLCRSLGVSRAAVYRRRRPRAERSTRTRASSPRALAPAERKAVLDVLHSDRFVDAAPPEVHATLLEEGTYLCSPRTMYRILTSNHEVRERRDHLRHPAYVKPELLATGPNQVWSWDITKLKGPRKWVYYYLYVLLDIFSRYVVGWMLAQSESGRLAQRLIEESCDKQSIEPGQLAIHADRGGPMISKGLGQLLADLGVDKSHSRPHVSNDNPFSESHFRTLKYRPEFPDRFGSPEHARDICRALFPWYNDEHHHSGLAFLTPAVVHHGRAEAVLAARYRTRLAAYVAHPDRFINGQPRCEKLPEAVWINPPKNTMHQDASGSMIVRLDDPEVVPIVSSYRSLPNSPQSFAVSTVEVAQ
jgi:putative transposase